jgi:hypothetical protein
MDIVNILYIFIIFFKKWMCLVVKAVQGFGGTRGTVAHAVLQVHAFHLKVVPCY